MLVITVLVALSRMVLISCTDDDAWDGHFTHEPQDVELKSHSAVVLRCAYNQTVNRCTWWAGDQEVLVKSERYIDFVGNETRGDCTISIAQPFVGLHTKSWQCSIKTLQWKTKATRWARVVVHDFKRYDDFDSHEYFSLMYVSSPIHTDISTVHLEVRTLHAVRIRWFVNGETAPDEQQDHISLVDPLANLINSSIQVDMANESYPVRFVHACVEFKRDFMEKKNIKIYQVYLVKRNFDFHFFEKLYDADQMNHLKLPMEVTIPQPMIYFRGQPVQKHSLVVEVEFPIMNDMTFRCLEVEAFPNSVLKWAVYMDQVEVTSDFEEFNATRNALVDDGEAISLLALMENSRSVLSLECWASNIYRPKFTEMVSRLRVTVLYKIPRCGERTADEANSSVGTSLSSCGLPLVILAWQAFVILNTSR